MPLSNKERQQRFRKRKEEQIGHDAARQIDNQRRRRRREQIRQDPEKDQLFREKQAERQRKARNQNKLNIKFPAFSSASSKSRSMRKARKALPNNVIQKKEVVKRLFEASIDATPKKKRLINQWVNNPGQEGAESRPPGRPSVISEEISEKLQNFLERSDVSYNLPGKNNQIYMGKKDGEKMFKPKKYLLYTFSQLHALLQKQDDQDLANLRFSTMYRFITKNRDYVGHSKIPHITCQCPDCENMELFIHGVNQSLAGTAEKLPENCHDLLEKVACNPLTKQCSQHSCPHCPLLEDICEFLDSVEEPVFYQTWRKDDKYYEKKPTSTTGKEAALHLRDKLKQLKHHYYVKRVQSQEYLRQIENLAKDQILVHCDYSENYKNRQANEIKAAYFGHQQFSIYTACVYYNNGRKVDVKNFGLVTQNNDHSCDVTFQLNMWLIGEMARIHKFKKIVFWSDGCSSQFRSQYTFYMLTKFPCEYDVEWHFFQANHGKGAVDGVGGTIKNTVFRRVQSQEVTILGPEHFATYANSILPTIDVKFVANSESGHEEECRRNSLPIPGTLKVHQVKRETLLANFRLTFWDTSVAEHVKLKEQLYPKVANQEIGPTHPARDVSFTEGDFVIITYEGEKFPGEISKVESINPPLVTVRCMKKDKACGSIWCWPSRDDEVIHYNPNLCEKAEKPKLYGFLTDRVLKFYVPELANIWGAVDINKCSNMPE